jgi:menaquinone-dependent protoporphyrinogen oxidase
MQDRVLLAYATKYGSTREVAERIGRIFREAGVPVEIKDVKTIKNLTGYSAVILGTAVFMHKVMPSAIRFIEKNRKTLQALPVAYFTLGVTMKTDNPANRASAEKYLEKLTDLKRPVSTGLFAGKLDYQKIGPFFRWSFQKDSTGLLSEGDFRDWNAIDSWARNVIPELTGTPDPA